MNKYVSAVADTLGNYSYSIGRGHYLLDTPAYMLWFMIQRIHLSVVRERNDCFIPENRSRGFVHL